MTEWKYWSDFVMITQSEWLIHSFFWELFFLFAALLHGTFSCERSNMWLVAQQPIIYGFFQASSIIIGTVIIDNIIIATYILIISMQTDIDAENVNFRFIFFHRHITCGAMHSQDWNKRKNKNKKNKKHYTLIFDSNNLQTW